MNSTRSRFHGFFFPREKVKKLGAPILFSSMAFAFIGTIWAILINRFVNSDAMVGMISSIFVVLSFISYFLIIPYIEKFNKSKIFIFSSIFLALGYFLYGISNGLYVFLIAATIVAISVTLRVSSLGIMIESSSKKRELSANEGYLYSISNLGWLIGPLIAGVILRILNIKYIFIFAGVLIILSTILFKETRVDCKIVKKRIDGNIIKNFKDFFKNKERTRAYILGSGVNFWWSMTFIYFPLLIITHLHEDYVGYLLFFAVLPLILTQYFFAKLAGKIGFKKIFFIGYMIPAILCLISFLFFGFWVAVIAVILASFGMAMTESTTESYFFDICKGKEDQRFYAPYNTAIETGQLLGEFIPAIVLLFLPFRYIFLVYFVGFCFLLFVSLSTKNIVESKRKNVLKKKR